jgi:SNF2 family DNA or RNA helicase
MQHQEDAIKFLESKGSKGLLAMEPGTGKTLTALEYLRRKDIFPALIIAPVSVLGMWKNEIERWYGWKTELLRGTPAERASKYLKSAADIYLISYETFRTDADLVQKYLPVHAVILDESGKIRTPTALISKRLRNYRPPVRIALDGTPVSNSIADLWNISEWLEPGIFLGNWWKFRKQNAVMNPYIPGKIDSWREPDKIASTASRNIFWKKKTDVLKDLPAMTQTDLFLDQSPEERRLYKQIKNELRLEIEGVQIPITNALALLMRLRQAANGVFTDPATPTKTKAVLDLLNGLPPGEKVVIFSQFETVVSRLIEDLPFKCVGITGAVSQEEREEAVKQFENDPEVRAIVMTSAGEKGLNLQCASYMIQYDLVWSAAAEEQRIGRIWRHGQSKPVTIWNLLMASTVDIHMRGILNRKKKLADAISSQDSVTYEDIKAILADE